MLQHTIRKTSEVVIMALVGALLLAAALFSVGSTQTPEARSYFLGDNVTREPFVALPANLPAYMTTPCAWEDSVDCYWDASEQGNGKGHSFYSICADNHLVVLYWQKRYAKKHNRVIGGGCSW